MRRWQPKAADAASLTPPADSRVCFVEDWITDDEIDGHTFSEDCPAPGHPTGGLADCTLHLARLAQSLHGEHRAEWLDRHGVPARQQCAVWPVGRARWHTAA